MPKEIQEPDLSRAATDLLGLKGRLPLLFDEVTVPVISFAQLPSSPYQLPEPCMGQRSQAAGGAGVFSGVAVVPVQAAILSVSRIRVSNVGTGGVQRAQVRLFGNGHLGTVTETSRVGLSALAKPYPDGTTTPRVASDVLAVTHTSLLGTIIHSHQVPQDETVVIELPRSIHLRGDDPAGPPALTVWWSDANTDLRATMEGAEWALRV